MFTLIFLTFLFVAFIYHVRKSNKLPKGIENVPFASPFSVIWALLRNKPQDEIQDLIRESSKGHDIYIVCHIMYYIF
jgi:hypothetical protein